MDTKQALADVGLTDLELTEDQRGQLDANGFFIVQDAFSADDVAEMKAEFDRLRQVEGDLGGHEVHIEPGAPRLSNLFNKSDAFDRCLRCQPTLAAAHQLLGEIQVYSLNARTPLKGEGQQPLHSDVPRVHPTDWRVVNSMILLDDMTLDNGPTRVVPGSHKWTPINVPDVNMAEVTHIEVRPEDREILPADPLAPYSGEIKITGPAGSVAVINGCIWHGGTASKSGAPRRVLHLAISRRDLPQQLVERQHLTAQLHRRSTPGQRYLLNIEHAEPVVIGYPPMPTDPRTWTAFKAADT